MKPLGLTVGVFLFAGCYSGVYESRVGRPYPEKPPSCAVTFDYVDQESGLRLLEGYLLVGGLEVPYQPTEFKWTPEMQDKLRPAACRRGGDLVAYEGPFWVGQDIGRVTWARFRVYRKRDVPLPGMTLPASPAPPAP